MKVLASSRPMGPKASKRQSNEESGLSTVQRQSNEESGPSTVKRPKYDEGCPKVKRKREDRSNKHKHRKTQKLTVVKSALRRYIKGSNSFVNTIIDRINERVRVLSRKTVDMTIAFAGWIKEKFDSVPDPATVNLDHVFEQTFFRQFLLGIDGAVMPDPRIADYHTRHPDLRPSTERHLGDRNLYSSAALRYETNLKNALRFSADNRIRCFCHRFAELHHLSSTEYVGMIYQLCGWPTLPRNLGGGVFPMRRDVHEAIREHRHVLGFTVFDKAWLRSDTCLEPLLRYNVLLNRFYEANEMKLFNVVPICNIKSHFVTIDTHVLYGIMKEVGVLDDSNSANYITEREKHWHATFKIAQLEGKECSFGYSIDTDGTSMCMHFERIKVFFDGEDTTGKIIVPDEIFVPGPNDLVTGCDPGRINIYYMATILPDGSIKTFILTRKQYYSESGIFASRRHIEHWNLGIKEHLEALSEVSSKGSSLQRHKMYLNVYYLHRDALWKEYTKPRWARQRLSLYGGKKRVFSRFFNNMTNELWSAVPDCNIVVAYGAAKFAPGGRGELSVPTSRAYKECVSRVTTKATPEFRSSKVDYLDDTVLQLVAVKKTRFSLRGVLYNVARKEFVSRDLNGAMNIRRYLLHQPDILNRRLATEKLVQRIVKRIKPRIPV